MEVERPPPNKRVDEIQGFIKFHQLLQKLLVMGRGRGHSTSVFYSAKLCCMINFSPLPNELCFSFVVVWYCMSSLSAIIIMQLLKWLLMKEVVMCNKSLKLENPLKVNRPLEFIEAP